MAARLACVRGAGEREVVLVTADGGSEVDLTADWVASDANAAKVIASLHHGEKRLVFADSRARVESIAATLRPRAPRCSFSHSSLSRDDRFQAERAFTETRDCVIVATSTLELALTSATSTAVIQIGAPATVASLRFSASATPADRDDAQLPVPGDQRDGAPPSARADSARPRWLGRTAWSRHRSR